MARSMTLVAATKDQVAQLTIAEAKARGYARDETLAIMATFYQESQWDETIWGPEGRKITYGIAQQDGSYPNRFNGAAAQIKGFFDKLDVWRRKAGASPDIWLNICWMQQRPNWESAQYWWDNGRRAYLTEIQSKISVVTPYLDKFWPTTGGTPMTWTGDPVWLEEVLRPALGDRLKTLPGWQNRGHGDFKDIRGVMMHHTGNRNASSESIRDGRSDLAGPLANIHIATDGTVTIVAVGVCWHAGAGSYPWLPTNNANWHMIGIECAHDGYEQWPDAQIIAMRDTAAALCLKLGVDATHVIGHKDYAGAAQGKWDPGNLDTRWFQGEVQKDMDGFVFPGEHPEMEPAPGPIVGPDYARETWDQLRIAWPQLGYRTLVDAMATIGAAIGLKGFYDPKAGTDDAAAVEQ